MALKLPSESDEWIDEYQEKLNESEEYSEAGEGWGIGFNGDFIFEIQPDDTYDGDSLYLFVGVEDGSCHDAYQTDDPDDEDWGFAFRGGYADWKRLIQGEVDPVEGMMDGTFDLDGDMQKVLQYSQAAVVMTEAAGEVDTEFEY
jgi:putative sterol carrier protein